jgi:prolipoprotein diacylglyceryltransferase
MTGFVSDRQPGDFHFALGVALLAAVLNTYALALEFAEAGEFRTLNSPTIPYIFLVIELGLLVNVAGLWVRKTAGMLVSMAALVSVGVGYVVWYAYSRQILELLLSKSFYHSYPEALPPHPLGLIGASWLNLVVLVISVVLFIWELKTIRGMMAAKP